MWGLWDTQEGAALLSLDETEECGSAALPGRAASTPSDGRVHGLIMETL